MTNKKNLFNINVRDRVVSLIYNKPDKTVEEEEHFNRNIGKE